MMVAGQGGLKWCQCAFQYQNGTFYNKFRLFVRGYFFENRSVAGALSISYTENYVPLCSSRTQLVSLGCTSTNLNSQLVDYSAL